ncbi:penicillin-binding protein [Streptomyces zinciresistens K42]|uniref:Penicillin-binding protein n=1 Tax=Streptomyces zinciresistens K42 TaxID=700597 RepID=G2GE07_9ACTN|nr:transglycosylase domain-containing protein [Streptomyces zinciresistens]EGX58253.1 penicillin-binding protein [Streptomyces zinciresistens K42]
MTRAGQEGPEPDETMQLKVPPPPADETMQLRTADLDPVRAEIAAAESRTGEGAKGDARAEGRSRRAPRPSLLARAKVLAAPLTARLAAWAAFLTPWLRRMRPDYPRPGREGWRRWVPTWRQGAGAVLTCFGLSTVFLGVSYAATDIPDNLNSYATQQDNVYFWSDGTPMARTGWVRRQNMPLKDIPEDVRWAVLAAENASFYSDPGISLSGLTRAVWRTFGEGDTQGGSTITQQYVKNVYLSQDRSVSRKFTEAMLALKLDNRMSKDDILEGYLNTSWFGRGTYGMQRAAQAYYGKDVRELNASEAAFLASLLKGAGLYDPALSKANRERAVERWSWILDRMVDLGKLPASERAKYRKFPEPLKQAVSNDTGKQSDYLVELAAQYAKKSAGIPDKEFDLGGYQIYTTFDRERENALTAAVTKARTKSVKDDPARAKAAHYGAASVATDGRILAVYGGADHRKQGYNESNATTVPAGSAFTPFVYAAALQNGVRTTRDGPVTPVTPQTLYNGDSGIPVTTPEGPYWDRGGKRVAVPNDGKKDYGQISLHQALAQSVNTPFMQLGMDTGLDKVRKTALAAGLLSSSFGPQVPAMSLGSATPSAIRMASGYATFAAEGNHVEPYSVSRITRNGSKVALERPDRRRAMSPQVAEQVQSALRDSLRLADPAAADSAPQAAGKRGTTQDDTASWYTGTVSEVSTAVVAYRIDLAKSLEPLPLKGLAGTRTDSVPYAIWSGALGLDRPVDRSS